MIQYGKKIFLVLSLAVIFCSGCLPQKQWRNSQIRVVERSYAKFAAATNCCNSLADFDFKIFTTGIILSLDENSQAYNFPQGISYFAALELPADRSSSRLRVKSLLVNDDPFIPASAMLFALATYLDAEKNPIATFEIEPVMFHAGFFGDTAGGVIGFSDIPANAKYVVFHTSERFFERAFHFSRQSSMAMVGTIFIPGNTYEFSVPFIGVGKLRIDWVSAEK